MSGYACQRLWRPRRRVPWRLSALHWLQPFRPVATGTIQGQPGPAQSELLRFALTRTSNPEETGPALKRRYADIFLEKWPGNSTPAPLWAVRPRGVESVLEETRLLAHQAQNLRQLQHFIEKSVISGQGADHGIQRSSVLLKSAFARCEQHNTYGDILAFINGLEARLRYLDRPKQDNLHFMGIRYACASLSESALKHHLRGYFAATNGRRAGLLQSRDIAKTFLYALRTLSFGGSKRDISTLLQLITGDAGPDTPNLHQVLCWAQGEPGRKYVGVYLSLLVHARDRTVRHDIWNQYLQLLNDPTFSDWTSAYTYAETLLEVGEVSEAQTVLAQFSKCVGNRLPGISSFRGLQKFLRVDAICETLAQIASENELKSLLLTEIGHIEKRLGLKWSKNKHKGLSQAGVVGDKPILTIDGDSPGLESPERLLAEIQDWGGSKFAADLSQVADTLDDLEGELVPMAVTDWPNADMELYWAIHRSPVELCSESRLEIPDSQKVSASNLGLVKVTRSSNESLFAFEPPLHLMQLGYLLAKRSPPDDKESGGEAIDTSSQLHETGYLVTWDRVSGIFVLVFAGKGHGRIAPTTEFSTLAAPLGCATIIPIPPQIDACDVSKYRFPKYRLELDPGLDLGFDTRT